MSLKKQSQIKNQIRWFFHFLWRQADPFEKGRIDIKAAWTVGRILKDL